MKDLFEGKIMGTTVDGMDRLYLGDIDEEDADGRWQAVLVVEEGCVRLYTYEYSDGYRGEEWKQCDEYFYNFEGYLNINTLGYVEIDFDNIDDTVGRLIDICHQGLTSNFNGHKSDLKDFLERHKKEIFPTVKTYAYYK